MACIYQASHGIRAGRLREFLRDVPDDAVIIRREGEAA